MLRTKTAVAGLVAIAAALTGVTAAPASAEWEAGRSAPAKDTVYPKHGNPKIDVMHYGLKLRWGTARGKLRGTANLHLRARSSTASFWLEMDRALKVRSLTVNGKNRKYTRKGRRLVIRRSVIAGSEYDVRIAYAGRPRSVKDRTTQPSVHRLGWHSNRRGAVWTFQRPYGAYTWYPSNDTPGDKALYDIIVNVPAKFVGVSNGRLVERTRSGGRQRTKWVVAEPMAPYQSTLVVDSLAVAKRTGPHALPIRYWYPRGKKGMLKPLLKTAGALRWLEDRLGPYPFGTLGIVVARSQDMSSTHSTLTFGRSNYKYGKRDVREQIAQLLVQQWYGGTVTPRTWRDLWLVEGFAEYLEGRYSAAKGWSEWDDWVAMWERNDQYWRDLYGPPGRYKASEFGQTNVRRCTARMLVHLRSKIGATAFANALSAWPQGRPNTNRTRAGYVNFMENQSGQELSSFFTTWLNSRESPG